MRISALAVLQEVDLGLCVKSSRSSWISQGIMFVCCFLSQDQSTEWPLRGLCVLDKGALLES